MELSYEQTKNFALNSSTSKQQHLFPKAKRFQTQKNEKQRIKFYTIQSTISSDGKKAPSFPKLRRTLQFPNQKAKRVVPSPSTYSLKSDIEKSIQGKKGITMAQSHRRLNKSMFTPGPSAYNPIKQPFATQKYSIGKQRKKFQFPIQLRKGNSSPGPAYLVNLSKLQKVVGKFVQKKCMKVYSEPSLKKINLENILNPQKKSMVHSSRLLKKEKQSQSMLGLQSNKKPNRNPLAQNHSSERQKKFPSLLSAKNTPSVLGKFGKAERKSIFEKKNQGQSPGPAYNWFSEFSRLQKNLYNQKLKQQKINKITKK